MSVLSCARQAIRTPNCLTLRRNPPLYMRHYATLSPRRNPLHALSPVFSSTISQPYVSRSYSSQSSKVYHIEKNTRLPLVPILRQTSENSQSSFMSFWKFGGLLLAGYTLKNGQDFIEPVYAQGSVTKNRLGSVDKLKPNSPVNLADFPEFEKDGEVYELVMKQNLALRHFESEDLRELRAYLPKMNVSVELKKKIIGLDEETCQKVTFSKEEVKVLRTQLIILGLNELNQKFGNTFRASVQNGQLVWRSVEVVDYIDIREIVDFETRHGRRAHINTGTHGDSYGNTVIDSAEYAEAEFSKEDLETVWIKDNISLHIVSKHGPPLYPKHIDRIDAWCFSEKTVQKVKKDFIDSLLGIVGARTRNGSTHIEIGPSQTASNISGVNFQAEQVNGSTININNSQNKTN